MSHELRTPLSAIIGFSELIRDHRADRTGANHIEWANAILSGGRQLLDTINNVLELARIEAGQCELADSRVNLAAVVRGCLVTVRPQAEQGKVALYCDLSDSDALLRGDSRAVRQVALNVLANAVKFTPEGGSVSIRVEWLPDGGIVLVVADTGVGIASAALATLGEPFVQGDTSTTRTHGGTGLGLAISRKLMLLHGGTLTIDSVVGQGTTVRAVFPKARVLAKREAGVLAGVAPSHTGG